MEADLTERAREWVFERVTLDSAVTLGDVFRLQEACPTLKHVFRRDFAEELCAEANKGPDGKPSESFPKFEGIEYLELYQQWGFGTSTKAYSPMQRLDLRGVGPDLVEDAEAYGRKKGSASTGRCR